MLLFYIWWLFQHGGLVLKRKYKMTKQAFGSQLKADW